jgi:hypothetical protein
MSGSIVFGGGFGVSGLLNLGLNSVEPAIFGTADPLVLGGVVLVDFEIPQQISWGGTQRIATHLLPGGERVFDVMGREEEPISWSGIFLGAGAIGKAIQWDTMRARGLVQPLQFGTLSYQVVVESFTADYRQRSHIPYKITCKVLRDNSAPLPSSSVSPEQSVSQDVSSASDAVPADAPANVVTKTKVETGPLTSTTQTFQPIEQTAPTVANANAAAGNNLPTSALSMVDLGPQSSLATATPESLTAQGIGVGPALSNAQSAADSQAILNANASLFTGS